MKNMRNIPKFRNEDEERDFWATHSPLDYFDINPARMIFEKNHEQ